jgi:ATP-binding cassette subfamily C protein LapB
MSDHNSSTKEDRAQQAVDSDIAASAESHIDSLLECLANVTGYYGHAKSTESIIAGLPYTEEGMGPKLFSEAAERLGYKTKLVKRKPHKIDAALLPVVILCADNKALVLHEIERSLVSGKAKDHIYHCYDPHEKRSVALSAPELTDRSTGSVFLIYPSKDGVMKPSDAHVASQGAFANHEHTADAIGAHWFWGVMWQNRSLYYRVALAALLINIFALASPLFIMNVYDRVIPNNAMETGWVLGIGALTVLMFDFIVRTLRGYFIDMAGRKMDVIVGRRIYDHVLDMNLSAKPPSSGVFASMLKEFDAVKEFFTSATMTGFVDLPFSLLFIFVIYLLAGPVAFVLLGLMIVAIIVGLVIQIPLRALIAKSLKAAEAKHGLLIETITGLETIKAIGADGKLRARYSDYIGEAAFVGQKSRFFSSLGVNLATVLQQSASIFIVLMGMYLVRDGSLTVGALIASVILGGRAIAPMAQIAGLLTRYHQSRSALRNIDQLMKTETERPANKKFLHRPDLKGHITFDRVSFSYPHTERKVLDNVSFDIKAGEKVGIIGRIGSGKSTIARLMMGLYQPNDGSILVDQTDYRQIDPADLRRNVGYIAQDVVLFTGSVRENVIAAHPTASEAEILHATKLSGAYEFISAHPHGFDMMIGERGEGLSGGQRQAIALARAILAKPNMLVCDEPTNSMDIQAEEAFAQHVKTHLGGEQDGQDKTLILITHRQMLMGLVDRLILIERGRVMADGPRDKVLEALSKGATIDQTNAQNKSKVH